MSEDGCGVFSAGAGCGVVVSGGGSGLGLSAGAVCWLAAGVSSLAGALVGSRLCFLVSF